MPYASIEGLSIHYDHYPARASAPAKQVIYIHGTGCNSKVFADHLMTISQSYEVVAIDLPGHGKSPGTGFRSAVEHAFFVGMLIEHLGWTSCIVAGHSLGGGIALAVAIYFKPIVSGLMLIDTGARLRVNPAVIERARLVAEGGTASRGDSRLGYADTTAQSVVDAVNLSNAGCDPKVIYNDWIADDSFDVISRLPAIEVPSLAICGADDPLTPVKYHEFLRDHLPNCKFTTVERAGHWPFVENPHAFNTQILDFLDHL